MMGHIYTQATETFLSSQLYTVVKDFQKVKEAIT